MSRIALQFEKPLDGQVGLDARSHNRLLCLAESPGGLVHDVRHGSKIDRVQRSNGQLKTNDCRVKMQRNEWHWLHRKESHVGAMQVVGQFTKPTRTRCVILRQMYCKFGS